MKKTLFITLMFIIESCTHQVYAKEIPNLACTKNSVRNYYQSGNYEKDVTSILKNARHYLQKRVSKNKKSNNPRKLAVILDIDDTSLSNFLALSKDDFSLLHLEASTARTDEPAIKPILSFYNFTIHNGVNVFFISMRSDNIRTNTITNLQKVGYSGWTGLYLPTIKENSRTYKTGIRKMLVEKGYDIILNIGDQYTDLDGGYTDKSYKLPNLMYSTAQKFCNKDDCS